LKKKFEFTSVEVADIIQAWLRNHGELNPNDGDEVQLYILDKNKQPEEMEDDMQLEVYSALKP
jgi:hypothetical protein